MATTHKRVSQAARAKLHQHCHTSATEEPLSPPSPMSTLLRNETKARDRKAAARGQQQQQQQQRLRAGGLATPKRRRSGQTTPRKHTTYKLTSSAEYLDSLAFFADVGFSDKALNLRALVLNDGNRNRALRWLRDQASGDYLRTPITHQRSPGTPITHQRSPGTPITHQRATGDSITHSRTDHVPMLDLAGAIVPPRGDREWLLFFALLIHSEYSIANIGLPAPHNELRQTFLLDRSAWSATYAFKDAKRNHTVPLAAAFAAVHSVSCAGDHLCDQRYCRLNGHEASDRGTHWLVLARRTAGDQTDSEPYARGRDITG